MGPLSLSVLALLAGNAPLAHPSDSLRVCVADAISRTPVYGASITVWPTPQPPITQQSTPRQSTPPAPVRPSPGAGACATVAGDSLLVQRVGYHAHTARLAGNNITQTVWLVPIGAQPAERELTHSSPHALSPVVVTSTRNRQSERAGRTTHTVLANNARRAGAATTAQLVSQLAYANVRSARGETALSLRGARREQVVVTLDGLPLNDPATGSADIRDIPLAALGSATAILGADPLGAGPGASGGVIALSSATQRMLAMRLGTLGERSVQGAWVAPLPSLVAHSAAMYQTSRNNFSFVNTAGASGTRSREVRVNNDETRASVTAGAIGNVWQLFVLGAWSERGMVGPQNVRTYDADRAITNTLMARAQYAANGIQVVGGSRVFSLAYRDPNRPALNTTAHAYAHDAEIRGQRTHTNPMAGNNAGAKPTWYLGWRAGGGVDQLTAGGGIAQQRNRLFASAHNVWQAVHTRAELGLRVDAVQPRGGQPTIVQPSLAVSAERRVLPQLTITARAAQAVRTPTLYDLYFSAPQRLSVVPLNAERVRADLELSVRAEFATPVGTVHATTAAVHRETRDAIVWFPGNFGWSPSNVGSEMLNGLDGRIALSSAPLTLSAWFTAYNTQLTLGDFTIPSPYVPQLAAGSQVVVRTPVGDVSALTHSLGRRPFTAGPANPDFELPAVTLVDMAFTKDVAHAQSLLPGRATVTLSVQNATNVAWQSVRGFPSPGRTWALSLTLQPTSSQ